MPKVRKVKTVDPIKLSLSYAFSMNCNITEACKIAGISSSAFWKRYPRGHPFHDRIAQLRGTPSINAKIALDKALKRAAKNGTENIDLALKYLERVNRDEFSLRSEHVGGEATRPLVIQINGYQPQGLMSDSYPRQAGGSTVEGPPQGPPQGALLGTGDGVDDNRDDDGA
jgi:hypothetical protein